MHGFELENKKQPVSDFDKWAAAALEKAVRRLPPRKTGISKARPITWINHIHSLRTKDGIEEQEIKSTLEWYCHHIGEEYVPEAFSGESFRKKYPAIRRQFKRIHLVPVEITKEARELAADLEALSWPPAAAACLLEAVQQSLCAYGSWRSGLNTYSKKLTTEHEEWIKKNMPGGKRKSPTAETLFAEWLVSIIPGSLTFVRGWFTEIHQMVRGWDDWDGNLSRFIFKPDSKRFQKIGERWAVDFTSDSKRWEEFYNGLCGEEK